ncbi:MAG TPA: hypothetical protein VGS23_09925 [Thermoplasmata archaeon]|nr:hypothetical protein [Thermoplasmata archaeon]
MEVTFRISRGGCSETLVAKVARGSPLRAALRSVRLFGEGVAVLDGDRSIPLDTPVLVASELTVVPTFSGG